MRRNLGFRKPGTCRVWRCQHAAFDFYAQSACVNEHVGKLYPTCHWREVAQEGDFWQLLEREFVALHAVRPRSEQIALEDWYAGDLLEVPGFIEDEYL